MLHYLFSGANSIDAALLVNRLALGIFFTLSGYHKLFNPIRHASIRDTMVNDHIPEANIFCWFVPCVEFFGGLGLIVGLLSPLAALGLLIVCVVATLTDGIKRIPNWNPLDRADYLDDILYLPEVLYGIALLVVIFAGSGAYSLDHIVLAYL